MHSKKIGTVLSVGLIHRFLLRLISPTRFIGRSQMRVNLFFDEADVATAFDTRNADLRNVVGVSAKTHVFVQIMR